MSARVATPATEPECQAGAGERFGHTLTRVGSLPEKDQTEKVTQRWQKVHAVTLKRGQAATYIAYAQDLTDVEIYLVVGQKIVTQNDTGQWYPSVSHTPEDDRASVYVVDPRDQDVSYTFFEYAWEAFEYAWEAPRS